MIYERIVAYSQMDECDGIFVLYGEDAKLLLEEMVATLKEGDEPENALIMQEIIDEGDPVGFFNSTPMFIEGVRLMAESNLTQAEIDAKPDGLSRSIKRAYLH